MTRSRTLRPAVLILLAAYGLSGCGTPTPYQHAVGGYGYSEQALEADRYRVTFAGNSLTSRQTVENYLLARAAELTLQRGYDHFLIVDRGTDRQTTYNTTVTSPPDPFWRDVYWRPYPHGWSGSATTWPEDSYAASANVVLRKGAKPADDPNAYDARAILERLGPAIARGAPGAS